MKHFFCPTCGEELTESENFCHFCGEKVSLFLDNSKNLEIIAELADEIKEIEKEINNNMFEEPPKEEKIEKIVEKPPKEKEKKIEEEKNKIRTDKEKEEKEEKENHPFLGTLFTNKARVALAAVLLSGGFAAQTFIVPNKINAPAKPDKEITEQKTIEEVKEVKEEKVNLIETYTIADFNEGYAFIKSKKTGIYYMIDTAGNVVRKIKNAEKEPFLLDNYIDIDGDIFEVNGAKILDKTQYDNVRYVGNGYVVVTKEGKIGIFNLISSEYVCELKESIKEIKYLRQNMFLIKTEEEKLLFNAKKDLTYDAKEYYDKINDNYIEGYLTYFDEDTKEVYVLDREGNKNLIATYEEKDKVSKLNSGLIFITDSFYDINGNKVLDLKAENVTNVPEFINGYALIIKEDKYFTVIDKETLTEMFEPKEFVYVNNDSTIIDKLGLYEGQTKLSGSGYLITKLENKNIWALMNKDGTISVELPENSKIETMISNDAYVGILNDKEYYYYSVYGVKITLNLDIDEEKIDVEQKEELEETNEEEKEVLEEIIVEDEKEIE